MTYKSREKTLIMDFIELLYDMELKIAILSEKGAYLNEIDRF
jgi:hypothetical protein